MNKRQPFAGFVLFLLLSLPSCAEERERLPALPGNPAPAFSLRDPDGNAVRLGDFAGRIVVLDFWATWCEPCRETTAEFERLHQKYAKKGVVFIGVSLDKGRGAAQKIREYAVKHGLTYRLLMNEDEVSSAYAVTRIPDTFVLDKNHRILKNYPGYAKSLANRIASDIEGLL